MRHKRSWENNHCQQVHRYQVNFWLHIDDFNDWKATKGKSNHSFILTDEMMEETCLSH